MIATTVTRASAPIAPPTPAGIGNASLDALYSRVDVLEQELRRLDALISLRKVEGTVEENTITMNAIVEEVNDVRATRYARKESSL